MTSGAKGAVGPTAGKVERADFTEDEIVEVKIKLPQPTTINLGGQSHRVLLLGEGSQQLDGPAREAGWIYAGTSKGIKIYTRTDSEKEAILRGLKADAAGDIKTAFGKLQRQIIKAGEKVGALPRLPHPTSVRLGDREYRALLLGQDMQHLHAKATKAGWKYVGASEGLIIFVRSNEDREILLQALKEGNLKI